MIRRRSILLAGLALPALAQAPFSLDAWTDRWEAILRARVDRQGRIDFAGLQANPAPLAAVTAALANAGPRSTPGALPDEASRLAFYLNAYNALCMQGIVSRGVPQSLGLIDRFAFFARTRFALDGDQIALKPLEDNIIRPMGEERVHFALNCMVAACPRLPQEAFRAARLESQLQAARVEFCDSPYHVRPQPADGVVFLSTIFQFYTSDFVPAKAPDLRAYVNRTRATPVPANLRVLFLEYDWTINRQPARGA
jgi:hypothetical protein